MRHHSILTLVVALSLSAPLAAAAFGVKGEWEPNTLLDQNGGYNNHARDITPTDAVPPVRKVYFNSFAGEYVGYVVGASTMLNPNVAGTGGAVQTGHQPYPWHTYAMLGVWKDCNKDNFIGHGEQGLLAYPAALIDTSVCKAVPPPNPMPKNYFYPHNDGTWIQEFVPIGWDTLGGPRDGNPTNINDSAARVWGDWGRPGDAPVGICYVAPHEQGTWHSVGGVTNYGDCFAAGRIRGTMNTAGLGGTYTTLQAVRNPWGEEADASYVSPWNCAGANPYLVSQPVGSAAYVNVSRPRTPPTTNFGGSPAGTANETASGFDECDRTTGQDKTSGSHPGQTLANLPYVTEEPSWISPYDDEPVSNTPAARHEPDWTLSYFEDTRPAPPLGTVLRYAPNDPTGLGLLSTEGFWEADSVTAASRNPYVDRGTLFAQKVTYATHYAYVSQAAQTLYGLTLSGKSGIYGAEACTLGIGAGKGTQGPAPGWKCDPALWWKNAYGIDNEPMFGTGGGGIISNQDHVKIGRRVGDSYNFRDTDCYDESVKGLRPIGWGTLTSAPCAWATGV